MMGGWCWEKFVLELSQRGHEAIVVDLPCEDVSVGFDGHVDEVLAASSHVPDEDLVLVGHSLGHTPVRASHRRKVAAVVFVCGVIPPRLGESNRYEPALEAPGAFEGAEKDELERLWFPHASDGIRDRFQDRSAEDAAWAASMLRRQATTPHREINQPVSPRRHPRCRSSAPTTGLRQPLGADGLRRNDSWGPLIELAGDHSPFISPHSRTDSIASVLL